MDDVRGMGGGERDHRPDGEALQFGAAERVVLLDASGLLLTLMQIGQVVGIATIGTLFRARRGRAGRRSQVEADMPGGTAG